MFNMNTSLTTAEYAELELQKRTAEIDQHFLNEMTNEKVRLMFRFKAQLKAATPPKNRWKLRRALRRVGYKEAIKLQQEERKWQNTGLLFQ